MKWMKWNIFFFGLVVSALGADKVVINLETATPTDGYWAVSMDNGRCLDCFESSQGRYELVHDGKSTRASCSWVKCSGGSGRDRGSFSAGDKPEKTTLLPRVNFQNPKYTSWLEMNNSQLLKQFGFVIADGNKVKSDNDSLKNLLSEWQERFFKLGQEKPRERIVRTPYNKGFVEFRSFGLAPYGSDDPTEALAEQKFFPSLDSTIRWQITNEAMEEIEIDSGMLLLQQAYRRSDGKVFVVNGVTKFPDGKVYIAYAYPPIRVGGMEYRYTMVDTCKNWCLLVSCPSLEVRNAPPENIKKTRIAENDTVIVKVPEPTPPVEEENRYYKVQSDLYSGASFPFRAPQYFNSFLGMNWSGYLPKDRANGYSKPHLGTEATVVGWFGKGHNNRDRTDPRELAYGGFECDMGIKLNIPIKVVAFTLSGSPGLYYARVKDWHADGDVGYRGRQTTFVVASRANFDIYLPKFTLNSWYQYIHGIKGYRKSFWEGNPLYPDTAGTGGGGLDPYETIDNISMGARFFFGENYKTRQYQDVFGGEPINLYMPKKVSLGITLKHNVIFEGVMNKKFDETRAYVSEGQLSFLFNNPRIILSFGSGYAYSFENYPNQWKWLVGFEKNLACKVVKKAK